MTQGTRWTDTEHERLIAMARQGELFSTIAEAMNRPYAGVRAKYLELVNAMSHAARREVRRERGANLKFLPQRFSLASAEQLAEREAREKARRAQSFFAAAMGDPPPGWSALDRKMTSGSIAS